MSPLLDNLLVRISLYEDVAAYKELFLLYYKRLVNFSTAITHKRETAEEVVNDVFLKIWTNREMLTSIGNFHLYIYAITKNLSINRLLKERKTCSFSIDEIIVALEDTGHSPEELMITAEMRKKIDAAINELPPRCRLIFKLVKEDGLKYRDVSSLLDLSVKTVENQMTIALKRMAQALQVELTKSLN
jgi:RNA polymerase sigma-70 factor (family 1)